MKRVPPFYPETIPVLSAIRSSKSEVNPLVTILLSEGKRGRLEHILETHDIRGQKLFDDIILAPKSEEVMHRAKETGLKLFPGSARSIEVVFILIGDSLQRDIKLGNQTGCITIYKPSAFKGIEIPTSPVEQPCFTITSLDELPAILRDNWGWPVLESE